jgi:mannan endo-1,4-beta-mannosidase
MSVANQTEVAWIINASGKTPALIGVDFMHATGKNSEGGWYKDYTNGTLALAENAFSRGGIPAYCWHWKDPSLTVESFYTPGNSSTTTDFNLNKAFSDSTTHAAFNTSSAEYVAMVRDLDIVAGYLKILADKGVPVLWRPLHEASGKWFWWGAKGGAATKALYRLMFDRFTITHGLNNLIWVWTSDEASDALEWYPGDAYVDIVGRDFYYYPREANHGSLASSFEKVKEIFSGKKLVTLSENGSIPHPDSLVSDGAGWSYFMPWYGDYTMDGWAHDNTAADWNSIMNHDYVITLDEMPGWASYVPSPVLAGKRGARNPASDPFGVSTMEIRNIKGERISTMAGQDPFSLKGLARGIYLIRTTNNLGIQVRQVFIK